MFLYVLYVPICPMYPTDDKSAFVKVMLGATGPLLEPMMTKGHGTI